jgi:hypothetical protein
MSSEPSIEQRILQCIDEALEKLGNSGRKTVLFHLKKNAGIKRKEIPRKPELFCRELDLILGKQGGASARKLIVKELLTGFGLHQNSSLTLYETIELIKATQNGTL